MFKWPWSVRQIISMSSDINHVPACHYSNPRARPCSWSCHKNTSTHTGVYQHIWLRASWSCRGMSSELLEAHSTGLLNSIHISYCHYYSTGKPGWYQQQWPNSNVCRCSGSHKQQQPNSNVHGCSGSHKRWTEGMDRHKWHGHKWLETAYKRWWAIAQNAVVTPILTSTNYHVAEF